jgi:hypothetical protein
MTPRPACRRAYALAAIGPAVGRDRPVAVGDAVEVGLLGGKVGRVLELRDGDAVVTVGAIKLTVPRASLAPTEQSTAPDAASTWTGDLPEVHVPTEIELREGIREFRKVDAVAAQVGAGTVGERDPRSRHRIAHHVRDLAHLHVVDSATDVERFVVHELARSFEHGQDRATNVLDVNEGPPRRTVAL